MDNNNTKKSAAVIFGVETVEYDPKDPQKETYSLKEYATYMRHQIEGQIVPTSVLRSHVLLGIEGSVACELKPIDKSKFSMHPSDAAHGLKDDDDSLKLYISCTLMQEFFYEKCDPHFASEAKKYVQKRINQLGVVGYALELCDAEECITTSKHPINGTERLVCTLYTIDPTYAMAYVSLGKRQCYSNMKDVGSVAEAFLERNESARRVEEYLSNGKAKNVTSIIRVGLNAIIRVMNAGADLSSLDDHRFFGGIPHGTPLEGTKSFKTKVEAELTGYVTPMEMAARYDVYFGPEDKDADCVFSTQFLEVPKSLTKKRGISEFPRLHNELGQNIVRCLQEVAKNNTYGALDLVGQKHSTDRVLECDMEEYGTLDSSNCTDSYTREHLKAFPAELEEPIQRMVPTFVVVNGKSVRNSIAMYMGATHTTFCSSEEMFAFCYFVGALVEAGVGSFIPEVPEGLSPVEAVEYFDAHVDPKWSAVNFFDTDEEGNPVLIRKLCEQITVWNDDIIVPAKWCGFMQNFMRGIGFVPNATKSYIRSSLVDGYDRPDIVVHGQGFRVRESCGAFRMRNLATNVEWAVEKLPTITRDDMPLKAIGVVRAASVAELFEECGYHRCARIIRAIVRDIVGPGFFDNFTEHGYFDDAPESMDLEEFSVWRYNSSLEGVPDYMNKTVLFPKAKLAMLPTPDYILGKKAQSEDRSAAYNLYLQERYYSTLQENRDGSITQTTDEFGLYIWDYKKDGTMELVDFATVYGILPDHMTYAEFIKTEDDVDIVVKELSHYDEVFFSVLSNWNKCEVFFEITEQRAGKALQKIVNTANRKGGGFGFTYPLPAVRFLLQQDHFAFRKWSVDELKVAIHLLNPNHVRLVEVKGDEPKSSNTQAVLGDSMSAEDFLQLVADRAAKKALENLNRGKGNSNPSRKKKGQSNPNSAKGTSQNSGSVNSKR
jgi:hypothetical protein